MRLGISFPIIPLFKDKAYVNECTSSVPLYASVTSLSIKLIYGRGDSRPIFFQKIDGPLWNMLPALGFLWVAMYNLILGSGKFGLDFLIYKKINSKIQ